MKKMSKIIKIFKKTPSKIPTLYVIEKYIPKYAKLLFDHKYHKVKLRKLTRGKILKKLKKEVENGFKAALSCRGISAEIHFAEVRMWNWILEEGLEDFNDYVLYGLPLFKATALKYGFDNPIGEDTGSEYIYTSEYNYGVGI
jgi:hypothetical protein